MMGSHHAASGAAAWVAVSSTAVAFPALGWYPLDPAGVLLGAVVCAGAALLPDADHHDATIAHALPGVGAAATAVVSAASGGHRNGTHSGLSAVVVLALAWFVADRGWLGAAWGDPANLVAGAAAGTLLAFAVKVLGLVRSWLLAWPLGLLAGLLVSWLAPAQWAWLPMCIAVGWIVHLAGDFLTVGGLPLFWPLSPGSPRWFRRIPLLGGTWSRGGYFALPVLGTTGSWREWLLMVPLSLYALGGMGVAVWALLN
ncbi:metal-dependent hydrolase [Agromyces soli]